MIKFKRESISEIVEDIQELIHLHWEEIGEAGDSSRELNIDYSMYITLEERDLLLICSARDESKLIGYTIFIAQPDKHHDGRWIAINDCMYLHPDYRKGRNGIKLLNFAEEELQRYGVQDVIVSSTKTKDISRLLVHKKYKELETLYIKKLGE